MVGHTRWTEKYYLVNDEKSLESGYLIFDFNSHFDALAIVLGKQSSYLFPNMGEVNIGFLQFC